MLHRVIMTAFAFCAMVFATIIFFACVTPFFRWYLLQNEANYLAVSMGKFGGYTTMAHENLENFIRDRNFDPSLLEVTVSAPDDPVPWGTPVSARINCIHPVRIGNITLPINVDLPPAEGWDTSRYVEGKYAVTYTSP